MESLFKNIQYFNFHLNFFNLLQNINNFSSSNPINGGPSFFLFKKSLETFFVEIALSQWKIQREGNIMLCG